MREFTKEVIYATIEKDDILHVVLTDGVYLGHFNDKTPISDVVFDTNSKDGMFNYKNVDDSYHLKYEKDSGFGDIYPTDFSYYIPKGGHCTIKKEREHRYLVTYNSISFYVSAIFGAESNLQFELE